MAAAIEQVPWELRPECASKALRQLRDGGTALSSRVPGSASAGPGRVPGSASARPAFDSAKLARMNQKQLRSLVTKTTGVLRNKKNAQGKWVPKTSSELIASLLASKASTLTQALPRGSTWAALKAGVFKRPAAFKRPSAP